jgi:hypothetical protein
MHGYDTQDQMVKVKSTQKKWKADFSGSALDTTKWEPVQTGSGHSITVTGGELTINTGTTINTETIIRSRDYFTIPFKSLFGFYVSQKIANQEFWMEVVSVDPNTGLPDGKEQAAWRIAGNDNLTTTNGVYVVQTSSMTALASTSSAINAVTAYSMLEIEAFADECWFHARNMDNVSGRTASYVRHQSIPNPNAYYKVQLRAKNLGTAPASTTAYKFNFVNVVDYAELTAEITAGRGNTAVGQAIATQVLNTPNVAVTGNPSVQGNVAHDGVATGNPVRIGAKALNAAPGAVSATGDVHDLITTMVGALIQKPYAIPEADWSYSLAAPVTTAVQTAVKSAGAAGIRNYVTGCQLQNTGATATEIQIQDGATVIWRGFLPASMMAIADINFNTPLRGTAATALNVNVVTAGCNVYFNVQGYQAP